MTSRFFGQEIKVTVSDELRIPAAFYLNDREYLISDIIMAWQDYGFSQAARHRRWWQRRHRNYYRVKTTDGEVFEIYYDRGPNLKYPERKKWFLHRQI